MRGVIQAISADGAYGQIAADDGTLYSYWTVEIKNGAGRIGQAVEFQIGDGQPIDISLAQATVAVAGRRPMPPAAAITASASSIPASGYWIKLFTSPHGRISRRQFWLHGALPIFIANIVLGWIPVVNLVLFIAVFWGSLCISFKRFHDRGLSGLWSLLYIVPLFIGLGFIAVAIADVADTLVPASIFMGMSSVIMVAQFFMVYVRAGKHGDNQYGPDPLAASDD